MSTSLLGWSDPFPLTPAFSSAAATLAPWVSAASRLAVTPNATQYTKNENVENEISAGVWDAHTAPTLPAPAVTKLPAHSDSAAMAP